MWRTLIFLELYLRSWILKTTNGFLETSLSPNTLDPKGMDRYGTYLVRYKVCIENKNEFVTGYMFSFD